MKLDSGTLQRYFDKVRRTKTAIEISRRRFLQGSLALASIPSQLSAFSDRTRFLLRGGNAIFLLDGVARWVIAPDRFAGNAYLAVLRHTDSEIRLRLNGARLAGTTLNFDLLFHTRRTMGRWLCSFEWNGATASNVDLVSWLTGESVLFDLPDPFQLFADTSLFSLAVQAGAVTLDSSWDFGFQQAFLRAPGSSSRLSTGGVVLRPSPSGYRSVLLETAGKSSLLSLKRKANSWGTDFVQLLERNHCVVQGPRELFSSIEFETFESEAGPSISALFLPQENHTHQLIPPGKLTDTTGRQFSLSLAEPAYAVASTPASGAQASFFSSLSSLHVASGPSYALVFDNPVNLKGDPAKADVQDQFDLGLSRLVFENYEDDETVFEFFLPQGSELDLWRFGGDPPLFETLVRSLWHALFHLHDTVPLDRIALRVTRPRDFLHLHFTFANIAISVRSGKPWLVAATGANLPVLTAHFLPQHMQEESFEENSKGQSDDISPIVPANMTLSGPTSLAFNFPLPAKGTPLTIANLLAWPNGAMRRHDDTSNLSDQQEQSGLHRTSIEAPYRLLVDSVEASSALVHQGAIPKDDLATPELWHTSLVAQSQLVIRASRTTAKTDNVTILFQNAQPGWKPGDTFAVLSPPELVGAFVLTSVSTDQKTVTYTQPLPALIRTNFNVSLANRFEAFQAIDYAPPIKRVSWSAGTSTIQFLGSIGFKAGDLINVTAPDQSSVCTSQPAAATTFQIANVPQQDTITFASAQDPKIDPGSLVSLLSATEVADISVDSDKITAHIKTKIPHGLRTGENVFIAATGSSLDMSSLPVKKIEDNQTFTVAAAAPLGFTDLTGKGLIVFTRWFPITSDDRRQVVELSSLNPEGFQQTAAANTIHPLAMEQLIFSALGGWARMEGNFNPDPQKNQDVKRFIYRFAQRRDYYVEVDYAGYLWPFAHRAIRIKVTQRFFYSSKDLVPPPENVCYLRTRFFVTIKQKTRNFIAASGTGLQLPFVRVDILTDSTPALYADSKPGVNPADTACTDAWFWPSLDADLPFLFQLRGYDSANPPNTVDFTAPLIWANLKTGTFASSDTEAVWQEYRDRKFAGTSTLRRTVSYGGAPLHFAESVSPGDTELHVTSINFLALLLGKAGDARYDPQPPATYTVPGDLDPNDPTPPVVFRPVLDTSLVDVPSVKAFSGQSASGGTQPVTVAYNKQFLKTAFNQVSSPSNAGQIVHPNPTEIFVDVQSSASLPYPGPKGGGMAVPIAPITAVSRHTGIVADGAGSTWDPTVAGASAPIFNPIKSFDLGSAKLLGCIPLSDAVAVLTDLGANLDLVPTLNVQKIVDTVEDVADIISSVVGQIQAAQNQLRTFNNAIKKQISASASSIQSRLQADFNAVTVTASQLGGNTLAKAYNDYSDQLKTTLVAMQNASFAPATVPQSVMDDLRAAADLDLSSALVNSVLTQLTAAEINNLSNHATIAVCTFADFQKSLANATKAALSPLNPSSLPTQQLANALDDLIACFGGNQSPSHIRSNAQALLKQLQQMFQVLKKPLQSSPALDSRLFDSYLAALQTTIVADLKTIVDDAKTALKYAVNDHVVAFSALYANFNTQYCNGTLPATPTSLALMQAVETFVVNNVALATDTNVVTDLDNQVNTALNGWADAVAQAAGQAVDGAQSAVALLNEALGAIDALNDLCNTLANLLETPIAVSATYTIAKIPMQDAPAGDPIFLAQRVDISGNIHNALLEIDATVSASVTPDDLTGASASVGTVIALTDFSLQLLPGASFVTVQFQSFQFTASTGQGTHSQCLLDKDNPVLLGDALGFVSGIVSAFAPLGNGAGGAPVIQPSGSGLGVGYSFTLPPIEAGGFQIIGLAFEALLILSFSGDPLKLRFYLASAQKHFLISAGIWGGGGFFGLEISSQGVDLVQGCMEFGAAAALDLGVADGEVHILGGIYFEFGDRRCILTGFVRAGGSLNILDIIEMTVEFYIGLTYQQIDSQTSVYGTCTVTVSISILFFSADVSLTMNWQWAGSKSGSNTARLDDHAQPALHAMLDRDMPVGGPYGAPAIYASDATGPAAPTSKTSRLAGWDQAMWDEYTGAFMKEIPSHA